MKVAEADYIPLVMTELDRVRLVERPCHTVSFGEFQTLLRGYQYFSDLSSGTDRFRVNKEISRNWKSFVLKLKGGAVDAKLHYQYWETARTFWSSFLDQARNVYVSGNFSPTWEFIREAALAPLSEDVNHALCLRSCLQIGSKTDLIHDAAIRYFQLFSGMVSLRKVVCMVNDGSADPCDLHPCIVHLSVYLSNLIEFPMREGVMRQIGSNKWNYQPLPRIDCAERRIYTPIHDSSTDS